MPLHHPRLLTITSLLLIILPTQLSSTFAHPPPPAFREAPAFRNADSCPAADNPPAAVHIAMALDYSTPYLRGSVAAVLSVLRHSACPENVAFHFLAAPAHHPALRDTLATAFPYLRLRLYPFDPATVRPLISSSIRRALDQPLNYARIYLADLIPASVHRVVYLDSDLIVVDDIAALWRTHLRSAVLGAPEYCHANFTQYFTPRFWSNPVFAGTFRNRRPCYFNTGVMVIDLEKWRAQGLTQTLEYWMRVQKRHRIYHLGSLPPFLLVFAGKVEPVEHRWNKHGLGGDNVEGQCRDLHPGPVSLLHWSGKGKPWLRLDANRGCTLDHLWSPYDLYRQESLFADS